MRKRILNREDVFLLSFPRPEPRPGPALDGDDDERLVARAEDMIRGETDDVEEENKETEFAELLAPEKLEVLSKKRRPTTPKAIHEAKQQGRGPLSKNVNRLDWMADFQKWLVAPPTSSLHRRERPVFLSEQETGVFHILNVRDVDEEVDEPINGQVEDVASSTGVLLDLHEDSTSSRSRTLVPPNIKLLFTYLAVIGPCRELFGNLIFDLVETLHWVSFQGQSAFLKLPRLAYTEYHDWTPAPPSQQEEIGGGSVSVISTSEQERRRTGASTRPSSPTSASSASQSQYHLPVQDLPHQLHTAVVDQDEEHDVDPQSYWTALGRACDVKRGESIGFEQIFDVAFLDKFLRERRGMGGIIVERDDNKYKRGRTSIPVSSSNVDFDAVLSTADLPFRDKLETQFACPSREDHTHNSNSSNSDGEEVVEYSFFDSPYPSRMSQMVCVRDRGSHDLDWKAAARAVRDVVAPALEEVSSRSSSSTVKKTSSRTKTSTIPTTSTTSTSSTQEMHTNKLNIGLYFYFVEGYESAGLHPGRYGKLDARSVGPSVWSGLRFSRRIRDLADKVILKFREDLVDVERVRDIDSGTRENDHERSFSTTSSTFLSAHWRRGDRKLGSQRRKLRQYRDADPVDFLRLLAGKGIFTGRMQSKESARPRTTTAPGASHPLHQDVDVEVQELQSKKSTRPRTTTLFLMSNEPLESKDMLVFAKLAKSDYDVDVVRIGLEDGEHESPSEGGPNYNITRSLVLRQYNSDSNSNYTSLVLAQKPKVLIPSTSLHPAELLALEMEIASRSDTFIGYGDGLLEGHCSAPSLIVHQIRLHDKGKDPAEWVFEQF
ncbi:unnamed protein product [Amoebophrya sp. A25]|nr:unnamed protein product [Amoebophrya sp. A25]|eukprot:GSA25T00004996001.1